MKRHRSGWSTMAGFIITLLSLLVFACTESRDAWSFSADVPSPVLASITGGEAEGTSETPKDAQNSNAGAAPTAPAISPSSLAPDEPAPTSSAAPETPVQKRAASKWPAIFLGTVVVIGVILVVVYFLTRERDD